MIGFPSVRPEEHRCKKYRIPMIMIVGFMDEKERARNMNYEEALRYIHSLLRFGMKPGLQRIQKLLSTVGDPQNQLKFIHVAGTNGKGSTCAMLSSILQKSGYRTGLYISPYIIDFRERMQIDGEMISKEELAGITEELRPIVEAFRGEGEEITEFELVTAIAFVWFARRKCDAVVLEVGLGGRFDATNVISCPLVSVVCSIDLDHTAILGDTLEQIAFEKCGIIKQGGRTAVYPCQKPEAEEVIEKIAQERNNQLYRVDLKEIEVLSQSLEGIHIRWNGMDFSIPFIGDYQIRNAVGVLSTVRALRENKLLNVSWQAVQQGIAETQFPARTEIISRDPLVVLDGGHNPAGARALVEVIEKFFRGRRITAVMGMLRDKNYQEAVSILCPYFSKVYTAAPDNPRALSAPELAEAAGCYCPSQPCDSAEEAVLSAKASMGENGMLLCCGSLYLSAQLRPILREQFSGTSI